MTDGGKVFITDSNIWIDLYFGRLIDELFLLPFRFLSPDVIIAEMKTPDGSQLVEKGLEVRSFLKKEVLDVMKLAEQHKRPSINDLSGDGDLRRLAMESKIEVHGILWILAICGKTAVVKAEWEFAHFGR